jgi:hypothetical protein
MVGLLLAIAHVYYSVGIIGQSSDLEMITPVSVESDEPRVLLELHQELETFFTHN